MKIAYGINPLKDGGVLVRPPRDGQAGSLSHYEAPPAAHPLPRSKWPAWAKLVALAREESDQGVGDTVARIIGPANSAAFKAWYRKKFGQACGCDQRQAEWNARYSYGNT